eukprot:3224993-Amphidinium_carterae.1
MRNALTLAEQTPWKPDTIYHSIVLQAHQTRVIMQRAHLATLGFKQRGHFISALRRFPYAVDGGRLPAANAAAAESMIKVINTLHTQSQH